jgi:hypothetical protein
MVLSFGFMVQETGAAAFTLPPPRRGGGALSYPFTMTPTVTGFKGIG